MDSPIRILLLADSHLGFDLPLKARSERRRRGHDFLTNHAAALAPALAGEVDVVVHGGDVFDRPHVPASLAYQAYGPLLRIASRGVPVFVLPGNHERARLPHPHLLSHPNVHVFDRARTYMLDVRGLRLQLAGFPYERRSVRTQFPELLESSGWRGEAADVRLLCMHHCFEGATVGPGDFTFTTARDVVRAADVPPDFAAVFSGHIHRPQVLERDLRGAPLVSPVLYPGSVERTSTAEAGEPKGYFRVDVACGPERARLRWRFCDLHARPMLLHSLVAPRGSAALERALRALVERAPANAVLRIRIEGDVDAAQLRVLSAGALRRWVPWTLNVEVRTAQGWPVARTRGAERARRLEAAPGANLELGL